MEFIDPLLLLIIVLLALFINVFFHELGHAAGMLVVTEGEIRLFVGSNGDPTKSLSWRIGRVRMFFKYNPFLWIKGCCIPPSETIPIDKQILYIAAGPMASLVLCLASWLFISNPFFTGIAGFMPGVIFYIALVVSISSLVPFQSRNIATQAGP